MRPIFRRILSVCVLPEAWGLRMALHSRKNRDNKAVRNFFAELVEPPFAESLVGPDVEALFRGGCFGKGIGDISAVDNQVFRGCKGIEYA